MIALKVVSNFLPLIGIVPIPIKGRLLYGRPLALVAGARARALYTRRRKCSAGRVRIRVPYYSGDIRW